MYLTTTLSGTNAAQVRICDLHLLAQCTLPCVTRSSKIAGRFGVKVEHLREPSACNLTFAGDPTVTSAQAVFVPPRGEYDPIEIGNSVQCLRTTQAAATYLCVQGAAEFSHDQPQTAAGGDNRA